MPPDLATTIAEIAATTDRSLSAVIRQLLRAALASPVQSKGTP